MVLVLIFCTITIIITIAFFLIILSTLRIDIKKYEISNIYVNSNESIKEIKNTCSSYEKKNAKYKLNLSLNVLDKIKILKLKLNNEKIKKIVLKMHLDKTKIKELEREIEINDIKEIMNIKPQISYMDLNIKIGIDDVLLTTYVIPIICTAISMLLPLVIEKSKAEKIKYIVTPMYNKGNVYDIKFNAGIKIKVIQVLKFIYKIYKNRRINNSKEIIKEKITQNV